MLKCTRDNPYTPNTCVTLYTRGFPKFCETQITGMLLGLDLNPQPLHRAGVIPTEKRIVRQNKNPSQKQE